MSRLPYCFAGRALNEDLPYSPPYRGRMPLLNAMPNGRRTTRRGCIGWRTPRRAMAVDDERSLEDPLAAPPAGEEGEAQQLDGGGEREYGEEVSAVGVEQCACPRSTSVTLR